VALVPELFELSVVAGLLPSAMPRQCAAEKACASLLDSSHRSRTAPPQATTRNRPGCRHRDTGTRAGDARRVSKPRQKEQLPTC
jgi:hypothetical protein